MTENVRSRGRLQLQMTCADPGIGIQEIVSAGITVYDAVFAQQDILVTFFISQKDYPKLLDIAKKKDYEVKLLKRGSVYCLLRSMAARPVLVAGILLVAFLSVYVPSRIFFIQVEGNDTLPAQLIIEHCAEAGIGFGSSRKDVRSQKAKDALLESLPQLQWAGVTTQGCVATVTVRERAEAPTPEQTHYGSIVAARDGVITACTFTKGTSLCHVGQSVKKGEVLISGYSDSGICLRMTGAEGEIYAMTSRTQSAVLPLQWSYSQQIEAVKKKYAIIIGKNRINFYKGSGISGSTCDKMYSQYYMTLPGGFRLPVVIISEIWTEVATNSSSLGQERAEAILSQYSQSYVSGQMIAGTILEGSEVCKLTDGFYRLDGIYACNEMIGRKQYEEIEAPNGKWD